MKHFALSLGNVENGFAVPLSDGGRARIVRLR
jgi:hypothetical protein